MENIVDDDDVPAVDDEETERKLLAGTSEDDELDHIDEEMLESDDEENNTQSKDSSQAKDDEEEDDEKLNEDDDDDVEEDDSSEDNDEQDEAEIKLYEETLASQPYDYDTHKLLIYKLHSMGELERLRVARENMSTTFPLTSDIWLAWIKDEIKLALSNEQKMAVIELCEKATHDYLCKYTKIINFLNLQNITFLH